MKSRMTNIVTTLSMTAMIADLFRVNNNFNPVHTLRTRIERGSIKVSSSKYRPHQGKKECARRLRQFPDNYPEFRALESKNIAANVHLPVKSSL